MSRIDIYRQPPIEVKWEMQWPYTDRFYARYNGYDLIVRIDGFCWIWEIYKAGTLIDFAGYHPCLPESELDAKVKCQRALNKHNP